MTASRRAAVEALIRRVTRAGTSEVKATSPRTGRASGGRGQVQALGRDAGDAVQGGPRPGDGGRGLGRARDLVIRIAAAATAGPAAGRSAKVIVDGASTARPWPVAMSCVTRAVRHRAAGLSARHRR